ncbi:hypothetical protein ANAEL_03461 [Anaerolineales bacterium]|nr:hypothetical protein ANAEL_03461 [Anaerolineales bacterium]
MKRINHYTIPVMVLFVLAISVMWATPARADDGETPPPPDTSVVDAPPPGEDVPDISTATDAPTLDTSPTNESATDVHPAADTPAEVPVVDAPSSSNESTKDVPPDANVTTQDPIAEDSTTEIPLAEDSPDIVVDEPAAPTVVQSVSEALASIPEGTNVVVLDASGQAVPLATQEAADIIIVSDPMWCPTGVTPGKTGCSSSYPNLSTLVASFVPKTNGVIWIQGGADSGGAVTIDGAGSWSSAANFALTLTGGWVGCSPTCVTTINTSNPSIFDTPISILNWNANVTLNDILITGLTDGAGTALTVITTKDIALTRVEVRDNAGSGADLDNSSGTGKVTVTSSKFNNNAGGRGLDVSSKGAITLNNVIANGNGLHAAYLDNSTASTAQPVTLAGTNTFSGNFYGLDIESKGAIILNNVSVTSSTYGYGAYLANDYATTPQNVTLTGTNVFSSNWGGLLVYSKGTITLNNVMANFNTNYYGAYLWNVASSTSAGVTLTGTNTFNGNSYGLDIESKGAITLNNVTAASNTYGYGAYLKNDYATTPKNVTLTGTNVFSSNRGGLLVYSNGVITLNNVTANFNTNDNGAYLRNLDSTTSTGVTLTGTNTFSNNHMTGLQVDSKGVVTLNNVTAQNNGWYDSTLDTYYGHGVKIDNTYATSPKTVSILGTNNFSGNANSGLVIQGTGTISVNNITANDNGWTDPADTEPWNSIRDTNDGVFLENGPSSSSNVTLTGYGRFNNNAGTGFYVITSGAITLIDIDAMENGGGGVLLDNCRDRGLGCTAPVAKNIIFNGTNIFASNKRNGLEVISAGTITTSNLIALSNGADGIILVNSLAETAMAITLKGYNEVKYNNNNGLFIYATGTITVNDLTANFNGNEGVYLRNTYGFPSDVKMTGIININNNVDGLEIHSSGAITVSNVSVCRNWHQGVWLDNSDASTPKPVIMTGTNIITQASFQGTGLGVTSVGPIIINNLTFTNNEHGAYLDNSRALTPMPITMTGTNIFNGNYEYGVIINSKGPVSLNNITVNENGWGMTGDYGRSGIIINNKYGDPKIPQNVMITGYGKFSNNAENGIEIVTYGTIILNNISANDNGLLDEATGGYGALLDNYSIGGLPKAVTLNGNNSFNNNYSGGLKVTSAGTITLNNVNANDNKMGFGAYLDNQKPDGIGGVIVTNTAVPKPSFSGNLGGDGLKILSNGNITLTEIIASDNNGFGAYLDNNYGAIPKLVTLKNTNIFNNNTNGGLYVESSGSISISNLHAWENDGYGATLNNAWFGAVGTVTLAGYNSFANNHTDGLVISSNRAIALSNIYTNLNGANGVSLDNTSSGHSAPQNITLSGFNYFYKNGDDGLHIETYGVITLNNIDANSNGLNHSSTTGWGVWLDNCGSTKSGNMYYYCQYGTVATGITLNGANYFGSNTQDGLWVTSLGPIKISNLVATENGADGVHLNNQWEFSNQGITLTGVNYFQDNIGLGLEARSNGSITMNSIRAERNDAGGAYLNNHSLTNVPVPVTLTGINIFQSNGGVSGLEIWSDSQITLNNIFANTNIGNGVFLNNIDLWLNSLISTKPGIKMTGINNFLQNQGDGLYLKSVGGIDLMHITSDRNNGNGLYASTSGNFIMACSGLSDNGGHGWYVEASGTTTLKGAHGLVNGLGNSNNPSAVIVRTCPPPLVPVIAPPQSLEEPERGGNHKYTPPIK